jgi:ParB family chromosome partitioning protein
MTIESAGEIVLIHVSQIVPGDNDRTVFDRAGLIELAESIREHGLAQPITVRPLGAGIFQIVAGERRFKAMSEILGSGEVPCIVRELDDQEASAIMLAENLGRKDLDPVDEALAYKKRMDDFGWTGPDIARRCGVSPDRVRKRLALCQVRGDILFHVRRGSFPVGHAEIIAVLDVNRQMMAARPIIDGQTINLRQFRSLVDRLYAEQTQVIMFEAPLFGGPLQQVEVHAQKISLADIPVADDLPDLTMGIENHTWAIVYDYVEKLIGAGMYREARVVGKVLQYLVKTHSVRLPVRAQIAAAEIPEGAELPERLSFNLIDLDV